MTKNFFFVQDLPAGASERDRELQLSGRRSHAALVAHERSRSRKKALSRASRPPSLSPTSSDVSPLLLPDTPTPSQTLVLSHSYQASPKDGEYRPIIRELEDDADSTDEFPPLPVSIEDEVSLQDFLAARQRLPILNQDINPMQLLYKGPGSDTPSFYRAREYFFNVAVPNNYPVYTILNVTNHHSQTLFELLKQDHYLHAWVGLAHFIRAALSPNPTMKAEAWYHLGTAMERLRRKISNPGYPQDGSVIASVMLLAWVTRGFGDTKEAEIHRKVLDVLVQKVGGLDNLGLDGHIKACVLQWESLWVVDSAESIFTKERSISLPDYPSLPLPSELEDKVAMLPTGFQQLIYEGVLPTDLIEILSRVADHLQPDMRHKLSQDVNITWRRRVHSDFWEACSSLAIPGVNFNKFLCLTLFVFIALEFAPNRSALRIMNIFNIPRMTLTTQLHLLEPLVELSTQRDCWVWMYMVVLSAWSDRGELDSMAERLLSQFLTLFPHVRTWNRLEEVLTQFFWSEQFERSCRASWDAILLVRGPPT